MNTKAYEVTAGNFGGLFEHLAQPELVRRVYFVDDSRKGFQNALLQLLSPCVAQTCPDAEIVQVTDNGSIYNAVNRVWSLVREEYVISFLADFRMIQTLPLRTVLRAFERYPEVYLIYLRVRGLFGYKDVVKDQLRQNYPWYRDYPDNEKEIWYYRDRRNRVYSIPYRLFMKQRESMPKEQWGVQLVPRPIDANNTLWIPKLPSKLLPTCPMSERFAGGPVIFRTEVVRRYFPLPETYRNRPAAVVLEVYFWNTDIDFKFYTGYLNLQAFAVGFGDPKRGLFEVQREYWGDFLGRNSQPVVQNTAGARKLEIQLHLLRIMHIVLLTRYRRVIGHLMSLQVKRFRHFMKKTPREKLQALRSLLKHVLSRLNRQKRLPVVIQYGVLPALAFNRDSGLVQKPKSDLVEQARAFWFNNIPDELHANRQAITRREIHVHGGPNPDLTCPICQRSEWLSRVRGANLFESHTCLQADYCRTLCKRQGDELWTHQHQNFDFSIGCNADLQAPRCLCIMPKDDKAPHGGFYQRFQTPNCDQWMLVFRRRLAQACQVDVVCDPVGVDWTKYDLVLMPNTGTNYKFRRPKIPVILYSHDFWQEKEGKQWVIDWLQPDVLLTPYPTPWRENFCLPVHTKVAFYAFFESQFFTRPNLEAKQYDLLVVGATGSPIYAPRVALIQQISALAERYRIEFSHHLGCVGAAWRGSVLQETSSGTVRYLNKWSEYLGSARYVTFGRMEYNILGAKYYEVLGSGAIPIFPEVADLRLLGIQPFEHYIPLSEIEGNNDRLAYLLEHYEDFQYIARNAVEWYAQVCYQMLFDDFEDLVRDLTGKQFPKRLIA